MRYDQVALRLIETLHKALHRNDPDARSVVTYEYADRGADWSTYATMAARAELTTSSREEAYFATSSQSRDPSMFRPQWQTKTPILGPFPTGSCDHSPMPPRWHTRRESPQSG